MEMGGGASGLFFVLAHGSMCRPDWLSGFHFNGCACAQLCFSPFLGEYLFFTCLKKHTKRISKTPDMPALRVLCDA